MNVLGEACGPHLNHYGRDEMRCIRMTAYLAGCVARDAGNRSMRLAGRATWSEADAEVARLAYDEVYPIEQEVRDNTASA